MALNADRVLTAILARHGEAMVINDGVDDHDVTGVFGLTWEQMQTGRVNGERSEPVVTMKQADFDATGAVRRNTITINAVIYTIDDVRPNLGGAVELEVYKS